MGLDKSNMATSVLTISVYENYLHEMVILICYSIKMKSFNHFWGFTDSHDCALHQSQAFLFSMGTQHTPYL